MQGGACRGSLSVPRTQRTETACRPRSWVQPRAQAAAGADLAADLLRDSHVNSAGEALEEVRGEALHSPRLAMEGVRS